MNDTTILAMDKPALLGGRPECAETLGIVKPLIPDLGTIHDRLATAMATGQLTNHGTYVRQLESELADYLSVKHAIAVANGTTGLMLLAKALVHRGDIIVPSFTFSATAHALTWAQQRPVFADILPNTYTLDPESVARSITKDTVAILGVHIYGHPCEIDRLQNVADYHRVPLLFDAAHAFGSRYKQRRVGSFGHAEVFSFHASKIFAVGEGGAITTNDDALARRVRALRTFGDVAGSDRTQVPGINGKMQEFNALIGLENLKVIDDHIAHRRTLGSLVTKELNTLPGLSLQTQRAHAYSNYQNLSMVVDEQVFGLSRDQLHLALKAEGIHARRYFYPALHEHEACKQAACAQRVELPVTEQIAKHVLCLPIYSQMKPSSAHKICTAVKRIHAHAAEVRQHLPREVQHD